DPVYGLSKYGRPVIQLGPHRFNRHSSCKGPRERWLCTRWPQGCRASIVTYDDPVVKTTRFGKPVLIHGKRRYNCTSGINRRAQKVLWRCVKWGNKVRCRVFDVMFIGGTGRRRPVLHIGNHRYYKNNRSTGRKANWFCTKSSCKPKCRASVTVIDDAIVCFNNEHNH
ncbi:hypothetical protein RR46_03783, partial [Papilio xuthus]